MASILAEGGGGIRGTPTAAWGRFSAGSRCMSHKRVCVCVWGGLQGGGGYKGGGGVDTAACYYAILTYITSGVSLATNKPHARLPVVSLGKFKYNAVSLAGYVSPEWYNKIPAFKKQFSLLSYTRCTSFV